MMLQFNGLVKVFLNQRVKYSRLNWQMIVPLSVRQSAEGRQNNRLSGDRREADDEGTRSDFAGDGQKHHLVAGG
jgi:hypothetical protein